VIVQPRKNRIRSACANIFIDGGEDLGSEWESPGVDLRQNDAATEIFGGICCLGKAFPLFGAIGLMDSVIVCGGACQMNGNGLFGLRDVEVLSISLPTWRDYLN
jgi:hypothetical protein